MRYTLSFLLVWGLSSCTLDSADLQSDQWNVINYWAIWCKPCREEIPELNRLDQEADITVVGVNFDGKQGAGLAADVADLDIQFRVIADPADTLGISRPTVLPTTLVVSPEGEVIATLVGPQTASSIATHIRRQP
jgi:thiol-disulfide isomerase/thioredoxin